MEEFRFKGHHVLRRWVSRIYKFSVAVSSSNLIRKDLLELGFVIEESKCEWYPKQTIVWLGFEWNTDLGILKVTSERIDKATKIIDVVESEPVTVTIQLNKC